jgi:hypothetical protein
MHSLAWRSTLGTFSIHVRVRSSGSLGTFSSSGRSGAKVRTVVYLRSNSAFVSTTSVPIFDCAAVTHVPKRGHAICGSTAAIGSWRSLRAGGCQGRLGRWRQLRNDGARSQRAEGPKPKGVHQLGQVFASSFIVPTVSNETAFAYTELSHDKPGASPAASTRPGYRR